MNSKRFVLAGGTGFIGQALARELRRRGDDVVILTRTPHDRTDGVQEVAWDGVRAGPWAEHLEGAAGVVNLAGRNINCPHTPENLAALTTSRVNSVRALAAAWPRLQVPPRVWVQAGAVGYYGDTADRFCDEATPPGAGNLAEICTAWEGALKEVPAPVPRLVTLRIGFVLGQAGGALPVLSRLTKLGLGGAVGSGRQFISWIHLADVVQMFVAALDEDYSGVYNAVGPGPVTNADFMRALRRAWHRPWSPPVPEFAVRLGARFMNSEPALALTSCRCVPRRLERAGFVFAFPKLDAALVDLCR